MGIAEDEETRNKKQEIRNKKQETRNKNKPARHSLNEGGKQKTKIKI